MIGGVNITFSIHATQEIELYPDKPRTKRRVRRILGKHGALTKRVPAVYRTPWGFIAHPSFRAAPTQGHLTWPA